MSPLATCFVCGKVRHPRYVLFPTDLDTRGVCSACCHGQTMVMWGWESWADYAYTSVVLRTGVVVVGLDANGYIFLTVDQDGDIVNLGVLASP